MALLGSNLSKKICVIGSSNILRLANRKNVISHSSAFHTSLCNSSNLVDVAVNEHGIATMKLGKKPVNSLNLEFLTEIRTNLEELHKNKAVQGLILTSANPGIFSAGLDILEMYQPDKQRLQEFWRSLQDMWLTLYGSRLATIAAINGHSPAGGCLMALSCDYRIMADGKFTIGLNETKLGIVAPFWFKDLYVNSIGQRQAEHGLQLGLLYSPSNAKSIGLVDEIVELDSVEQTAHEELKKWLKIPPMARYATKMSIREKAITKLKIEQDADIEKFCNFAMMDKVQKSLGFYLDSLKKKSK